MIGIGVAEVSGLIGAVMRMLVLKSPRALLTPVVVFCVVLPNAASEVGHVLLVPLAALIFKAAGRHPALGLVAAFAGVSGGYSANLVLGTIDPLLAGISQEAARISRLRREPGCELLLHVRLDVPDHRSRRVGDGTAGSARPRRQRVFEHGRRCAVRRPREAAHAGRETRPAIRRGAVRPPDRSAALGPASVERISTRPGDRQRAALAVPQGHRGDHLGLRRGTRRRCSCRCPCCSATRRR